MPVFQSDFGRVCSSHCSASTRPALITPVRIPKHPTPLSWLADVSYFQPYRPTQMSHIHTAYQCQIKHFDCSSRQLVLQSPQRCSQNVQPVQKTSLQRTTACQKTSLQRNSACPKTRHWEILETQKLTNLSHVMDVFEKRSSDLSWQGPPGFFFNIVVFYSKKTDRLKLGKC